ncbi:CPBP family intramembrane glutamic endopeptidase [Nocardioides gilvus]|uniref:CPBP family intramembrane glutamic endopeptidase n=1 Tax=Nocardioides gilvus TaxID=1735589 RepID=UPI000D745651|nr:type II CAAX endopeptidase family protein [Nocardioides gilvus]
MTHSSDVVGEVAVVTPPQATAYGYHQLHQLRGRSVWRALVGALLVAAVGLGLMPVLWMLVFVIGGALAGMEQGALIDQLSLTGEATPLALAFLMVSLASAIPVVWLFSRLLHGLRPGWTTSVFGRMRWKYFAVCIGLSVVALVATLVVGALMPATAQTPEMTGVNEFTSTTRNFLLVVIFLVPFQAAGEEYLFRGYLTQAFGGLFSDPWISRVAAVLVPALLFALAHGPQDPPIFVDRFAFGLVAGVLVIATGGLEAAIAMHVLNNFVAFGLALAFTDMTSALNPTGGTWWSLPSTLTQSFVYLGLAVWAARRMGLANQVWGAVLLAPKGAV